MALSQKERGKKGKMKKILWATLVLGHSVNVYLKRHRQQIWIRSSQVQACITYKFVWVFGPWHFCLQHQSPPYCLTDCLLPLPRNFYNQVIARITSHPWVEARNFIPSLTQPLLTWAIRWCCKLTRRDMAICIEPKIATTSSFPSSIAGASYS